MRRKLSLISFSLLMAFFQNSYGAIARTDSLSFLENQIDHLSERDLVVFDMDDVLIILQDAILQHRDLLDQITKKHVQSLSLSDKLHLFSLIWKQGKTALVETHTPALIRELQKRGIKVIVLTAAHVGRVGIIEDTVSFRIQELKEKEIDLSSSFPHLSHITLHELNHGKGSPAFCNGVMLSHHFSKGEVLAAFLKVLDWQPRRLIFIDDLIENVESVEKHIGKLGIEELQCWHYTAFKKHRKEVHTPTAELQVRTLFQKGIWLSDQEAYSLLHISLQN